MAYKSWLGVILLIEASASAAPRVMVTAFVPFAGRKDNGSQLVATELAALYPSGNAKLDLTVCILPVAYEDGAKAAEACFEKVSVTPERVLSMGEGGCDIRLETRFHDVDDASIADNAGVKLAHTAIDSAGAPELPSTLPLPLMYCAAKAEQPLRPSLDPGGFVCNDTAYRLASYFRAKKLPYGFVHVPNGSCKNLNPKLTAQAIGRMLEASHGQPLQPMPVARDEAAKNQKLLTTSEACFSEFYSKLLSLYDQKSK